MKEQTDSQHSESQRRGAHFRARDKETNWLQGELRPELLRMHPMWVAEQTEKERRRLRPGVLGQHIAEFTTPEDAQWVAKRLNFAARIERIALTSMDDHALGTRVAEAFSDYKASPD